MNRVEDLENKETREECKNYQWSLHSSKDFGIFPPPGFSLFLCLSLYIVIYVHYVCVIYVYTYNTDKTYIHIYI